MEGRSDHAFTMSKRPAFSPTTMMPYHRPARQAKRLALSSDNDAPPPFGNDVRQKRADRFHAERRIISVASMMWSGFPGRRVVSPFQSTRGGATRPRPLSLCPGLTCCCVGSEKEERGVRERVTRSVLGSTRPTVASWFLRPTAEAAIKRPGHQGPGWHARARRGPTHSIS